MKNILVILTDQQRKDSLGCYGNPICKTPNIDRLAENGIRFNRNYVANPICMPSRLCIFTGKNIRNHGLWTNGLLIKEQETVAGHFASQGYATATIGKLHFTPHGAGGENNMESGTYWDERKKEFPVKWDGPYWGFEHVELILGHNHAPVAHYGEWFYKNGGTDEMIKAHKNENGFKTAIRKMPENLHNSAFVADRSIEFMKSSREVGKPFFLVASFPDPHAPFAPPESTAKKYSPENVVMPTGGKEDLASRPKHYMEHFTGNWDRGRKRTPKPDGVSEAETRDRIAKTYAMVDLIDQNVGKILDFIGKVGLQDDTVVLFTSDHGELLGDHGLWGKGPFYYDCLINTALIVSCPSLFKPRVSDTLFSDIDIAPTLCDMAGIPRMPFMDGISQMPYMLHKGVEVRDRCLIEYRNGYGEKDCSSKVLVRKDCKYVRYQTGEEELTDLSKDPGEKINLAGDPEYRELKEKMIKEMLDEILSTEQKGPLQLSHG